MTAPCNAYIPALGRECGRPGGPVRRACVHEHIRDAHLCPQHLAHTESGYCQPCYRTDGHNCPIAIAELAAGGAQ